MRFKQTVNNVALNTLKQDFDGKALCVTLQPILMP